MGSVRFSCFRILPPYDEPYEIVSRHEKFFTIVRHGKRVVVSIDRLKPAFILADDTEDAPAHRLPRLRQATRHNPYTLRRPALGPTAVRVRVIYTNISTKKSELETDICFMQHTRIYPTHSQVVSYDAPTVVNNGILQ
jgi:hypothetical protein